MADENQTPNPATPATPAPVTADPIAAPTPSPAAAGGNTSGQGSSAVVPEEVKGWSWGGFLLSWIWAIGNSVWIGLLALVPYVGLIMAIVLGAKGREWAWQAKHWDSIEHFKRVQKKWGIAGLIVVAIPVVLILLLIIIVAINPAARMNNQ